MTPLPLDRPVFLPYKREPGALPPRALAPPLGVLGAALPFGSPEHDLRFDRGFNGTIYILCLNCRVRIPVPDKPLLQAEMIELLSGLVADHVAPAPFTLAELTDLGYFDPEAP